jgi:hypothetical protein
MQKLIFPFLSLILTFGRPGKKDDATSGSPKAPTAPGFDGAMDPATGPGQAPGAMSPGQDSVVSANPTPPNPEIRPLATTDEPTCQTMCGHLAWCNQKMHQKTTSPAALSACVGGCGHRRGESDKGRWEAMEGCLKQHRGEDCAGLRACVDAAMLELQKRLHGMEPATPAPETKETP